MAGKHGSCIYKVCIALRPPTIEFCNRTISAILKSSLFLKVDFFFSLKPLKIWFPWARLLLGATLLWVAWAAPWDLGLRSCCSRGMCWYPLSRLPPGVMQKSVVCAANWSTDTYRLCCHQGAILLGVACIATWGHGDVPVLAAVEGNIWVWGLQAAGVSVDIHDLSYCQRPCGYQWSVLPPETLAMSMALLWRARRLLLPWHWSMTAGAQLKRDMGLL